MKKIAFAIAAMLVFAASAPAFARPEDSEYSASKEISAAGDYSATEATEFVVSGTISGAVSVSAEAASRITLKDATLEGVLTISGGSDVELWLEGDSTITTSEATAIDASAAASLTLCGTGSLAVTAAGAKKVGVVSAVDFTLAGADTTITISGNNKNGCGVYVAGNYTQTAGSLNVVATGAKKQNGVFLATKKMTATITGGRLDCTLAGEKSVGLAMDKATTTGTMSGGVLAFAMSGDGAKGVKGDGSFTVTGGLIDATLTGGYTEDLLEYEDDDDVTWNFYVTLDGTGYTSGNSTYGSSSKTVKTSTLIANGSYAVYDPSKCYAVKVGTLTVSGGTIRVRATGSAGRGLGADNMYLQGGVFDIAVSGGPTDVYVESLIDADDDAFDPDKVPLALDSGSAACLKTSGTNSVMQITGGTYQLVASGTAGKLINAAGHLIIGYTGSSTYPTDSSFSPDIQGQALGQRVYTTYYKQKYYGTLAYATGRINEDDFDESSYSTASEKVVTASSSGGAGDDYDYSNSKGIKAQSSVIVNGGRIRVYTANEGGEGLESKATMTINGGVIEFNCADDCINTAGDLTINGGYIYAASTGNDGIDSNANITINGGWIYSFTLSSPEEAFDVNSGYKVTINGGYIFGIGAAQSVRDGTLAGSQKYYQGTYSIGTTATYLKASGTYTIYGKIPAAASSTSGYLFVSVPGMSSGTAPTSAGTSTPSANSVGFHGFYTTGSTK